jgi:hypothetical protein
VFLLIVDFKADRYGDEEKQQYAAAYHENAQTGSLGS